ncbi:MAG: hypothetical protein WC052_00735 [Patescibacteria group bacterium]|jgi:hypothetical protein
MANFASTLKAGATISLNDTRASITADGNTVNFYAEDIERGRLGVRSATVSTEDRITIAVIGAVIVFETYQTWAITAALAMLIGWIALCAVIYREVHRRCRYTVLDVTLVNGGRIIQVFPFDVDDHKELARFVIAITAAKIRAMIT